MIKYLIIDDEHVAHDIITGYCDMLPNMELMKNCYNAMEALEYLNSDQVDLIFLDLNMPVLKGFDFLKTLPAPPKIIVTTAYSEYAIEGYELNISDYLLKPFGFERFLKAVNKAMSSSKDLQNTTPQKGKTNDSIFLKSNKKYIQVSLSDVLYIEAYGNYTKIVLVKEIITIRDKFTSVLELLRNMDLIRVHKSFAVSKRHIKSIGGNQIFIADFVVPIGKVYKTNINRLIQ